MAAAVLTAALILPLHPHTVTELEAWEADWSARAEEQGWTLTPELAFEFSDMRERHAWHYFPQPEEVQTERRYGAPVATPPSVAASADGWYALVAAYFPPDMVGLALEVIQCESHGDPNATNPSSGAAGLFQHIPRYWPERSSAAGWAGANIYDPAANVAVAAWLAVTDGWHHWNPSRYCWS